MYGDEVILEMARTDRELRARVLAKQQAQQLGEAFAGLDDRRDATSPLRGADRRTA